VKLVQVIPVSVTEPILFKALVAASTLLGLSILTTTALIPVRVPAEFWQS